MVVTSWAEGHGSGCLLLAERMKPHRVRSSVDGMGAAQERLQGVSERVETALVTVSWARERSS